MPPSNPRYTTFWLLQVMDRRGRAVERVCKQLPEAGSGQDPSRGAACAAERLGDLACCAMNVLRKLLPESLPTGPSSLRQFGSSVAAALQRVCGLLHRPGRSMPLPVETSLFWAVRDVTTTVCCHGGMCVGVLMLLCECPPALVPAMRAARLNVEGSLGRACADGITCSSTQHRQKGHTSV